MSYPYDLPAYSMSTIWQSGNYKPNDVVRVIRDNYTPVNKNSMRNSVGQEISLVQNYVNSKYLGRSELPIQQGYLNNIYSVSGIFQIYNESGYIMMSPSEQTIINVGTSIHYNSFNKDQMSITSADMVGPFVFEIKSSDIKNSGIYISHVNPNGDDTNPIYENLDINPSHILFNASGSTFNAYKPIGFIVHPNYAGTSGWIQCSGSLTINSGVPYSSYGNRGGSYYGLTVGGAGGYGNAFFKTHDGGGISIYGGKNGPNNAFDYIWSNAPEAFCIGVEGGPLITMDIATDKINLSRTSGGGAHVKCGRFGCNDVDPTGMASPATGADSEKIAAILDVLKNYGMMSGVV